MTPAPSDMTDGQLSEEVPTGCDFHEAYFGANYPDACCIDGYLWDLDSCDKPGGPLHSGGDVPCPKCNHHNWLSSFEDTIEMEGYEAFERGEPRRRPYKKVRHEQAVDPARMGRWFCRGWDLAKKEDAHAKK